MKNGTRTILLVTVALFALLLTCPPWQYTYDSNGQHGAHTRKPAGHSFVFDPPGPEKNLPSFGVELDTHRFLIESLALVSGAAFAALLKISKRGFLVICWVTLALIVVGLVGALAAKHIRPGFDVSDPHAAVVATNHFEDLIPKKKNPYDDLPDATK